MHDEFIPLLKSLHVPLLRGRPRLLVKDREGEAEVFTPAELAQILFCASGELLTVAAAQIRTKA